MSGSIFEQVTSSLTVMSICGSLGPDIPAGIDLFELENQLDPGEDPNWGPWNDPSRVMDSNGNLVGILSFGNYALEEEGLIDDVMERPEPWQFLSSGTTILEAVQLVASVSNTDFYVLHGNQVVGHLRYRHIATYFSQLAGLLSLLLLWKLRSKHLGCANIHHSARMLGSRFLITEETKLSRYLGSDMGVNPSNQWISTD